MRIAIIGAGFTGLSAAYHLSKKGHEVSVFEKDREPGGLAVGYKEKEWQWSLEKHYHHWFTNDTTVLHLAKEIGFDTVIKRPKTSIFIEQEIFQLDSPLHVLLLPKLSARQRFQMAVILGFLKYNPLWQPLEKIRASEFLPRAMGKTPYEKIWKPQLFNKFGEEYKNVSLAWFWARIKKRTSSLVYPKGGFLHFANALVKKIKENGATFYFEKEISKLTQKDEKIFITLQENKKEKQYQFDQAIITLPSFLFLKIAPQLPETYRNQFHKLKGLGAVNMVLRLKEQLLKDNTYWLSVCDTSSPVMAIVEHTNFMDKKYYNNEHLAYLGNYVTTEDKRFTYSDKELFQLYAPFLSKINSEYKKHLISYKVFRVPFAQPIIPINYSKLIPPFITPLKHVYLANIEQVYPWDRGTNYAVELGEKVARLISNS